MVGLSNKTTQVHYLLHAFCNHQVYIYIYICLCILFIVILIYLYLHIHVCWCIRVTFCLIKSFLRLTNPMKFKLGIAQSMSQKLHYLSPAYFNEPMKNYYAISSATSGR